MPLANRRQPSGPASFDAGHARRLPAVAAIARWAALLLAAGAAQAAVIEDVDRSQPPSAAASAPGESSARSSSGHYQLRCWQYGKLLFEENGLTLPSELSGWSVRVPGTDKQGQPLYVAETRNATCLMKSMPPARAR